MKLKALLLRIAECKTMGELEFVEDLHVTGQFSGMDKVDLQIACLNKFQELANGGADK